MSQPPENEKPDGQPSGQPAQNQGQGQNPAQSQGQPQPQQGQRPQPAQNPAAPQPAGTPSPNQGQNPPQNPLGGIQMQMGGGGSDEPPPPSWFSVWREKIQSGFLHYIWPYLEPVWQKLQPYWQRFGLRPALWFWQKLVALFWRLAQSRLGVFVQNKAQKYAQQFLATPIGQKCAAYVQEKITLWQARIAHGKELYKKLTSPPPDPIMAAMMMENEPIDMDEDIKVGGSRVFKFIFGFVVVFILWASIAELDESVRADGFIVPPSSVQLVQNRLPGSLISIEVKLGQHVKKGEVLFKLEDEDVIANFSDNEITRIAALAMKARLEAEVDGLEEIAFPDWLPLLAPKKVEDERKVFRRRQKALNTRLVSIDRRIKNHEDRIAILKPLVEEGHEARLTLVEAEGQYNLAVDEREAVLANFRADASAQLAEVNREADQAGAREDALIAKVAHAEVRAPTSGTVSAVHVKTVGAVVQAGTVLAEIVPDEKNLLVRARLLAEDVTDVYPGQIAQVGLAAYDVSRYGTLEGRVQRVAQNTTQEEGMAPYYVTMIEIPEARFSKSNEDIVIVPGSPVMVDIIGHKRTVMNYILTPLERAAGKAFREK